MTTRTLQVGIAVAVAIAVVVIFFIFNPFINQQVLQQQTSSTTAQDLVVQDNVVGTGAIAQNGDMLTLHYTGKLDNGTVFDTSANSAPYKFVLGAGDVIPAWDRGLQGMRVGGKRLLIVPPHLAYGETGFGPIPPNATLTFEVELLKVTPASDVAPFPEGLEAH